MGGVWSERGGFGSERGDLGPEGGDLGSEGALLGPKKPGGEDRRMNLCNGSPLCPTGHWPFGDAAQKRGGGESLPYV